MRKRGGCKRALGTRAPLALPGGPNERKRPLTATLRERAKDRILGARGSGVSEQLGKSGFGRHM